MAKNWTKNWTSNRVVSASAAVVAPKQPEKKCSGSKRKAPPRNHAGVQLQQQVQAAAESGSTDPEEPDKKSSRKAKAANPAAPLVAATDSSSPTPHSAITAPATTELTAVTAVLQAMQAQQSQFLAAQQRSEQRSEASHRAAAEAHMEMVRLAQSGQQSVMELVRTHVHSAGFIQ